MIEGDFVWCCKKTFDLSPSILQVHVLCSFLLNTYCHKVSEVSLSAWSSVVKSYISIPCWFTLCDLNRQENQLSLNISNWLESLRDKIGFVLGPLKEDHR